MSLRQPSDAGSPVAGPASKGPREAAISYDRWVEENRPRARAAQLRAAACRAERPVRRRPRHPDEVAALTELVKARWERALATGDVVELGPRRFRLRV